MSLSPDMIFVPTRNFDKLDSGSVPVAVANFIATRSLESIDQAVDEVSCKVMFSSFAWLRSRDR